jgi:apolipoprotein N-acyltransferase
VENRVPVVRAVNTGVSASIDSNGRIVAEVRKNGRNTMISGTLLLDGANRGTVEYLPGHGPKVLVDRRVSWYSRVGDIFALTVVLAAAAWVMGMFALCGRRKEGLGK